MEESKYVITINREFGTGGHEIAEKIGQLLDIKVYDKSILSSLTEKYNLSVEEMERIKARKSNWWTDFCRFYSQHTSMYSYAGGRNINTVNREITSLELYHAEAQILNNLAKQESCVIVGRTGFHIFKDNPDAMRILFVANEDYRLSRIMKLYGINEEEAKKRMKEYDESRENFTKTFAGTSRYDARNYDIVLNVTGFSTDQVAQFIAKNVLLKYPQK